MITLIFVFQILCRNKLCVLNPIRQMEIIGILNLIVVGKIRVGPEL